jgi:cytochrome c-type biogenesis protein CcmE
MGRRWFFAGAATITVVLVVVLFANLLDANTVYYLEPREALDQRADLPDGESFRLGGLVVAGTIEVADDVVHFTVTDYAVEIPVVTSATPPELFDAGIPVILEGSFAGDVFEADEIILRHEEEYDTPEGTLDS